MPGDDDEVFDADGAPAGIVEAGFDGDDVAGPEGDVGFADSGGFVDFQADAVAGAVEEALHAAVDFSG